MIALLCCPHCRSAVPLGAPGVFHCGRCGRPYTVASHEQLAVEAKRKTDERNVLMLIGAVVFVFYVAPVLLTVGYMCVMFGVYAVLAIVFGVAAAAG
ncbi:MAG: hypothetical protein KF729_13660 [Sandaracinaceae bacterium]|nr:hypothetical protein [Sandaracinaceae bacterium]